MNLDSAPLLYFAYGSNMPSARIGQRISSARALGPAWVSGHSLRFHMHSPNDQSGKCDMWFTGDPKDEVHGVLYQITPSDRVILDRYEGLGACYLSKQVETQTSQGSLAAFAYYAIEESICVTSKPYSWYKNHVLLGAQEHGLPAQYIAQIHRVAATEDHDSERHRLELAIHQSVAD